MAVSSAILGKNTTNNFIHAKSFKRVCQFFGIHTNGIMHRTRFSAQFRLLSKGVNKDSTKQKLFWNCMIVGSVDQCSFHNINMESVNKQGHPALIASQKNQLFDGDVCTRRCLSAFTFIFDKGLRKSTLINKTSPCHNAYGPSYQQRLSKGPERSSSKLLHHQSQYQNLRHFSGKRGGNRPGDDDGDDRDDDEKRRRLKGAVMYVTNPLTWISKQWNLAKLRRQLDPLFSESEFLHGASQAVSHVSQMVSSGQFDQLSGLVVEEVIEWFKPFRQSLTAVEQEALSLAPADVVLMKIRYVNLDTDQEKGVAFVDCVCFGLRLCDHVPFLVDMGFRFKRDYFSNPPSDWIVAGVTHIRLQNLSSG